MTTPLPPAPARASRDTTRPGRPETAPARVHLIIGPVGAGKSTFAHRLAHEHAALCLNLDDWMSALFSPDRPESNTMAWYVERAERCNRQIWKVTESAIDAGTDVVLEIGLILRRDREALYALANIARIALSIYVLDAPREVRRARVERRNTERGATFSMVVPPGIFELASDLWESPSDEECADRDVRFVDHARAP